MPLFAAFLPMPLIIFYLFFIWFFTIFIHIYLLIYSSSLNTFHSRSFLYFLIHHLYLRTLIHLLIAFMHPPFFVFPLLTYSTSLFTFLYWFTHGFSQPPFSIFHVFPYSSFYLLWLIRLLIVFIHPPFFVFPILPCSSSYLLSLSIDLPFTPRSARTWRHRKLR